MPGCSCLSERTRDSIKIVLMTALHIFLATVLPIFNKELYGLVPHPVFLTFVQVVLSIPPALVLAWAAMRHRRFRDWAIPPREVWGATLFSSTAFGLMMGIHNLGIFVSDINLATLFKLSGIVWQGVLAKMLLGEVITWLTWAAIVLVMCGIFLIAAKFEWSTDRMPSATQIIVHVFAIIFQSFASISTKRVLNVLRDRGHELPVLVVFSWQYVIATIPLLVMSLLMEWDVWESGCNVFTAKSFGLTLVGVAIGEIFQFLGTSITHKLSVIASAICGQLKHIPTLFISHIIYKETKWTWNQITGAVVLSIGTFLFTISRMDCLNPPPQLDAPSSSEDIISFHEEEDSAEESMTSPHPLS